MKRTLFSIILIINLLTLTSYLDNDIYNPDKQNDEGTVELDLSFKLALKSEKEISVTATDPQITPKRIARRYNIYSPFAAADADDNGVLIPGQCRQ